MRALPSNPTFIVGFPRSGTTLMQGILSTQVGWFSVPETHFFSVVERSLVANEAGQVEEACLGAVLESIHEKTRVRFAASVVDELTRTARDGRLVPRDIFETLVGHWLDLFHPGWEAELTDWIEKTPTHANFLFRILAVYPEARFVHVVRHPLPAIASRIAKFPFNRDTPPEQLARQWNLLQDHVASFALSYPHRLKTVRYENLVESHASVLESVSAHLGFVFDHSRLALYGETVSHLVLPDEPWKVDAPGWPPTSTNARSSAMLSSESATAIERITAPWLARLGYQSSPGTPHPAGSGSSHSGDEG